MGIVFEGKGIKLFAAMMLGSFASAPSASSPLSVTFKPLMHRVSDSTEDLISTLARYM
jgi:hypothetical protein